jgi:hypothetical protein
MKKDKWPILKDRLNNKLTSRGEALKQMKENGDVLTPIAEKELNKYLTSSKNSDSINV